MIKSDLHEKVQIIQNIRNADRQYQKTWGILNMEVLNC